MRRIPPARKIDVTGKSGLFRGLSGLSIGIVTFSLCLLTGNSSQATNELIPLSDTTCLLNLDLLSTGEVVGQQFAASGIHISALSYQSFPDAAIIFDSDTTGTPDPDIEVGIGNLLILPVDTIDANNDGFVDIPDKSFIGGIIIFDFDDPEYIHSISLVDVDNAPLPLPVIKLYDASNTLIASITAFYSGNGVIQVVDIMTDGVSRMEVHFPGSGAVGQIVTGCPFLVTACSSTDALCNGGADGTASIMAAGGTTPYIYQWDAGTGNQSTATATGLSAGSYTVTVTDFKGLISIDTCTVAEPDPLVLLLKGTPVTCKGACDGSALASASGGTGFAYTYLWSDPMAQVSAFPIGLCAGSYTVTVTDINGCIIVDSVVITEPSAISLTTTGTDASCFGVCDGSATALANGGNFGFSYVWDDPNNQTTPTATGLCAGTYTVVATDLKGCSDTVTYTVNQPGETTALITPEDSAGICGLEPVQFFGHPAGGSGIYTHAWTASGGSFDDPSLQNPVYTMGMSGTYQIIYTVTDTSGCFASDTTSVTIADCGSIGDYVWCDDNGDGIQDPMESPIASVVIELLDSMGNVIGTMTTDSNGFYDFTGLIAGTYSVNVVDATVPVGKALTTGNDPMTVNLNPGEDYNDADFGYQYTGSIGDYVWCDDNGDGIQDPTESPIAGVVIELLDDMGNVIGTMTTDANGAYDFTNLPPGMYTVNVVDSTAPEGKVLTTGNDPLNANLGPGEDYNDADFGYQPTGSIGDYVWCDDNGDGIQDPTEAPIGGVVIELLDDMGNVIGTMTTDANGFYDFTNLLEGTYTVNVVDSTVSEGKALTTGNDPLTVNLAPGEDYNDADFGYIYTGSIGDYIWCDTNDDGIQDPGEPPISGVSVVLLDDMGGVIGTMTTDANGFYDFTNLPPGMYTVDVVDTTVPVGKVLTTGNDPLNVNLGPGEDFNDADFGYNCIPPTLATFTTPVSCTGGSDGSIDLTLSGGTGPTYSYLWSNGATTEDISGLFAGVYSVTVLDPNGCSATAADTIDEPDSLIVTVAGTDANCTDSCDGMATVMAAGGNGNYTFQWDANANNQVSVNATGLCAGSYSVTVTDSKGCTGTAMVTIGEPAPVQIGITKMNVTCNGDCDGIAIASASGGSGNFSYTWDANAGNQATATATGLCAGTYAVTVTDANGCIAISTAVISEPAVLTATPGGTPVSCFNGCDGSASVTAAGGNASFTYAWDSAAGNQTTVTATGLCAGSYQVTVTDNNGCIATASYIVTQPTELTVTAVADDESCANDCNGFGSASAAGGTPPYAYLWSAGTGGQTTAVAAELCVGSYSVTVTDSNGCTAVDSVTISGPQPLTASVMRTDVSCNGFCDGTATVNAIGGTTAYSYLWDDTSAQTTQTATGLCAGIYNVTVTDTNGCTATASIEISENEALEVTLAGSANPTCFGELNGSATVLAMGGTGMGTYTYLWNDPMAQTTATAINLAAGIYEVTVTDTNNCMASISVELIEPKEFTATIFAQNATCDSICDGVAVVSTLGGTGISNTYAWNDPNGQTTAIATGLCPGTYTVTATDVNSCNATATITITALNPICPVISAALPDKVEIISKSYPNPFTSSTNIQFSVAESANTHVRVFDATGQMVAEPFNQYAEAGEIYTVQVLTPGFVEGIYFYQIMTSSGASDRKAIICLKR